MTTYTAFAGTQRLVRGTALEVALAVRAQARLDDTLVLIFEDSSGRQVDFDLSGSESALRARMASAESARNPKAGAPSHSSSESTIDPIAAGKRGRGRPRLGVIGREVTLLPRHWAWLNSQQGGASVALRKLVDEARRSGPDPARREAQDAAYRFMNAIAGDLPDFEEGCRALYRGDQANFLSHLNRWPDDVRNHALELAAAAFG